MDTLTPPPTWDQLRQVARHVDVGARARPGFHALREAAQALGAGLDRIRPHLILATKARQSDPELPGLPRHRAPAWKRARRRMVAASRRHNRRVR